MGGNKTTNSTQTTTQKVTPTAEETELNKLLLERERANQQGVIQAQGQGLNLINQLLVGGTLPGFLNTLPGGISPSLTQSIVDDSLADVNAGLNSQGLLDSGVAAELQARTSADIRQSAEQFNIGNLLNLLNLAVGGQAQVQQPLLAQSQQLSNALAGLRSTTNTGTSSQTVNQGNPFVNSFASSLGQSFGSFGLQSSNKGFRLGGF